MLTLASMLRGTQSEMPIEDRPMSRAERLREWLASRNQQSFPNQEQSFPPGKDGITPLMKPDKFPPGKDGVTPLMLNDRSLMGGPFGKKPGGY